MYTITIIALLSTVVYFYYRSSTHKTADDIIGGFTKTVVRLENHAEDKIKASSFYQTAAEASLELKAKAEEEAKKAQVYADKLKGFFA